MSDKRNNINKDHFEDVLKEKLKNYSPPLETASWEDMEKRLGQASKVMLYRKQIAVSLAVAASIAVLWIIFPFNKNINNIENYETTIQLSQNAEETPTNVFEKENDGIVSSSDCENQSTSFWKKETRSQKLDVGVHGNEVVLAENTPETSIEEKESVEEPTIKHYEYEKETYVLPQDSYSFKTKTSKKKTSIGLSLGAGKDYYAYNQASSFHESNAASSGPPLAKAPRNMRSVLFNYNDFEHIDYNVPLSFGLNVRKEINDRFAIESGIIYTYLSTSFSNDDPERKAKSELHYLGIPLTGVVNLYANKGWNIYFSAGGTLEKGLSQKYTQELKEGEDTTQKTKASGDIDGVQWSIHFAPGVEYKFTKDYSFYFEPRLSYHFDNDQPVSIRTEEPLNINITAGLRFSF